MKFQLADVQRPLIAVSHITRAGNKVELLEDGGVITNRKTGKTIKIQREGGVYVLNMWVVPPKPKGAVASGFPRPGKA